MNRAVIPALALMLALWTAGCGASDREVDETSACLVQVTIGNVTGSGVLYGADGTYLYVLTARHVAEVLEPEGKALLRFCDGWETWCGDVSLCGTADLAMVRVPTGQVSRQRRKRYRCADWDKESFDMLQAKDECVAIGFTGEGDLARFQGSMLDPWIYMEDYGQYMIWADVEIRPGMSGGGLLDQEGRLIGILSGGSQDGDAAAVPLNLVWQFLEDSGSQITGGVPGEIIGEN